MAFQSSTPWIPDTEVGGDFAFQIGGVSGVSGGQDISTKFMENTATGAATDEKGALTGFTGTTSAPSESIQRPGDDVLRLDLPTFSVKGVETTPPLRWELKRQVERDSEGGQSYRYQLWRYDASRQEWATHGSWTWNDTGPVDPQIEYGKRIIIAQYMYAGMREGVPQNQAREAADEFVRGRERTGGNGMAVGVGIAVVAGLAIFLIAGR